MQYLIVLVFIFVYAMGYDLGYNSSTPLYTHLSYMFQHASILHLVMNSLAFVTMFRACKLFVSKYWVFAISVIVALGASFFGVYELKTVGASGMVYAMMGFYIFSYLDANKPTRSFYIFLLAISVSIVISVFKESSNVFLHIAALIGGVLVSLFNNILRD